MDIISAEMPHTFPFKFPFSAKEVLSAIIVVLVLVKSVQSFILEAKKGFERMCDESSEYAAFEALSGPPSVPFLGIPISYLFAKDPLSWLVQQIQKYGALIKAQYLGTTLVMLNKPEDIKTFLMSSDFGHLSKSPHVRLLWPKGYAQDACILLDGQEWYNRRKLLNHSYTYRALKTYTGSFNKHSERLVTDLKKLFSDGKVHSESVALLVTTCILHQSSETLMGVDISDTEDGKIFVETVKRQLTLTMSRITKPWLMINWVFQLIHGKEQDEMMQQLLRIIRKIISSHKERLKGEGDSLTAVANSEETSIDDEDIDVKPRSVIEVMIRNGLSDEQILYEVGVSLGVAQDTTPVTILNALFFLALYPEIQRKCQEEVDQIFDDESKYSNGYLEFNAHAELKYLERCISESQRMYPLVLVFRKLTKPLKLSNGVVIPAGASATTGLANFNPEYFPDPMKFDPDRFLPEVARKRHPFAFTPFAGGPRVCLGMKLALVEMKIVIAKILRHFNLSTPDTREDIKMKFMIILKPEKPYNFRFEPRILN